MYQWSVLLSLLGVVVVGYYCQSSSDQVDGIVSVALPSGAQIRGREQHTFYANREYVAFKGVPYAEAPVGTLRFKAPVVKTLSGTVDALEYGSVCMQHGAAGSEDCLFLNIFTPEVKPTHSRPVMVYIHGGSFYEGSGNDDFLGPDFLIEEDVILVTLNYRLGVFGFLSLGTAEYSGNMGLKDQQLALRWLKQHITHFGGDPEQITLFGQSAGGASTHLHVLMDSSAGLFRRAIVMSGSAGNYWAVQPESEQMLPMFALARFYDKTISTYPELLKWLAEAPVDAFMEHIDTRVDIDLAESRIALVWAPMVEKPRFVQPILLEEHLFSELKTIRDIDVMFGLVSAEWIWLMGPKLADPSKLDYLDEKFDIVQPFLEFAQHRETDIYASMMDEIQTFYFGEDATVNRDTFPELVQALSDVILGYGIAKSADKHATLSQGKTYYYRISADTGLNGFKILTNTTALEGMAHADDLCYIFKCNILPNLYNHAEDSTERKVQRNILKLWTNFAKFGNPTPDGQPIPLNPYTVADRHFVDISNDGLATALGPNQRQYKFWDKLHAKYTKLFANADPTSALDKDEL